MPYRGSALQDELLRFSGSGGQPYQDLTTASTYYSDWVYVGEGKQFGARPVVSGSVTGTSPTLDIKYQDSADGVSGTDMGVSFTQITTSDQVVTGSLAEGQFRAVAARSGRPWMRTAMVVGGTTPAFYGVGILTSPITEPIP